jgi:hypothetical protein
MGGSGTFGGRIGGRYKVFMAAAGVACERRRRRRGGRRAAGRGPRQMRQRPVTGMLRFFIGGLWRATHEHGAGAAGSHACPVCVGAPLAWASLVTCSTFHLSHATEHTHARTHTHTHTSKPTQVLHQLEPPGPQRPQGRRRQPEGRGLLQCPHQRAAEERHRPRCHPLPLGPAAGQPGRIRGGRAAAAIHCPRSGRASDTVFLGRKSSTQTVSMSSIPAPVQNCQARRPAC